MLRFSVFLLILSLPSVAAAQPLTAVEARHLLARTGFGQPLPAEVRAWTGMDRTKAVRQLIRNAETEPVEPWPVWMGDLPPRGRGGRPANPDALSQEERRARVIKVRTYGREAKAWWLAQMLHTPTPLGERMVLAWHNHFTSSIRKVKWVPALLWQQQTLRTHALGSFADLLHAMTYDPAMLAYLDGLRSADGAPNENYARELLELFTLGEGHYDEAAIKDVARAFTGYRPRPVQGQPQVRKISRLHDDGRKIIFGQTGTFDADDVVALLLAHPRTAVHVTEKLWRVFIGHPPDPAQVAPIATAFRSSGYAIPVLLEGLLLAPAFWEPANRGTMIKAPVDVVIGTLRLAGMKDTEGLERIIPAMRAMEQDLFDPPNVKGWPGGAAWITSATLLAREQVLERAVRGAALPVAVLEGLDPYALSPPLAAMQALLLATAPVEPPDPDADPASMVRALVLDPAFQLK